MRKFLKIQSELSVQSTNKKKFLIDNHYKIIFKSQKCVYFLQGDYAARWDSTHAVFIRGDEPPVRLFTPWYFLLIRDGAGGGGGNLRKSG